MKVSRSLIKGYLARLDIDPTHRGFEQLCDCVEVRLADKNINISGIYAKVSSKYGIQGESVMRNITYALNKVSDLTERLSAMLGFTVTRNSLHNGKIVFYIADLIADPEMFDFKL